MAVARWVPDSSFRGGPTMFLLATDFFDKLIEENLLIAFIAIGGGFCVAIVAIVFTCVKEMVVQRSREHTKREMAAYVAEGTVDPDKAVAILKANSNAEA